MRTCLCAKADQSEGLPVRESPRSSACARAIRRARRSGPGANRSLPATSQPTTQPTSSRPSHSGHLALSVSLSFAVAFVVQLFTLGECQCHLGYSFLEIQFQRDQSQPFSFDRSDQTTDFAPMEQQFAAPRRLVIDVAAPFVRLDVRIQ